MQSNLIVSYFSLFQVAQSLVDHEVLHAITSPTPHNFEDNDQCYRLQAQEKTGALNTMQVFRGLCVPCAAYSACCIAGKGQWQGLQCG